MRHSQVDLPCIYFAGNRGGVVHFVVYLRDRQKFLAEHWHDIGLQKRSDDPTIVTALVPRPTMEFPTEVNFDEEVQLRMTLTGTPVTDFKGTGEFEIGETEDFMWTTKRPAGTF